MEPVERRLIVARGYVQLVTTGGWRGELRRRGQARGLAGGRSNGGGRGDGGQTARSRNNMRRLFASLPWELLGRWPAMVSLTYPNQWREWVPDGRVWDAHRRALERRWVRQWNAPLVGVWAKEFQSRGAPHLHLYVGLPEAISADDFEGLRQRTLLRRRLERRYGQYGGRGRMPAIGGDYGGDFGMWLRTAWSEVVGTQGVVQRHHARGVDVAVMFWSDEVAAEADRTRVAAYLGNEAGKFRQKQPPADFSRVGRYYGYWGRTVGFEPLVGEVVLDPAVANELERRLVRWVRLKMLAKGYRREESKGFEQRRIGDGITAYDLGLEEVGRLLRWSEKAALRREELARRSRDVSPVRLWWPA